MGEALPNGATAVIDRNSGAKLNWVEAGAVAQQCPQHEAFAPIVVSPRVFLQQQECFDREQCDVAEARIWTASAGNTPSASNKIVAAIRRNITRIIALLADLNQIYLPI